MEPELRIRARGQFRFNRREFDQARADVDTASPGGKLQVQAGMTRFRRGERPVERCQRFTEARDQAHEPLVGTRLDQRADEQQVDLPPGFGSTQGLAEALGVARGAQPAKAGRAFRLLGRATAVGRVFGPGPSGPGWLWYTQQPVGRVAQR